MLILFHCVCYSAVKNGRSQNENISIQILWCIFFNWLQGWVKIGITYHWPVTNLLVGWLVLQKSIAAEDSTVFIGGGCSSCICSGKQGECINHHQQGGGESGSCQRSRKEYQHRTYGRGFWEGLLFRIVDGAHEHEQLRGLSTRSVARGPGGKPISWGTLPILIFLVFPFHYSHKCSPDFHSDFIGPTVMFYPMQSKATLYETRNRILVGLQMRKFSVSSKDGKLDK